MKDSGSALKKIFKRFELQNNPDGKSHKEHVIEQYSLLVTDKKGVEFRAIPVVMIEKFIKEYCK